MNYRQTYLNIDLDNFLNNIYYIKSYSKKALFAVVKANAYGLGALEMAETALLAGVDYLAVATLEEALELRKKLTTIPILVFGYVAVTDVNIALKHNLTLSCHSLNWAQELRALNIENLKIHIKIDVGMHRIGIIDYDEAQATVELLKNNQNIEGIYTHYPSGDNLSLTTKQFNTFKEIVTKLNYPFKWIHACNSSSIFTLKENFTNAVRPGLALYGYLKESDLKPVASLHSKITHIKKLPANVAISYDGRYITSKDTIIATVPIGYGDGINPIYKKRNVFIEGKLYPIVGTICMDQLMIEVDKVFPLETEVEIFGNNHTMEKYCQETGEIPYHVITHLSNRVPRNYYKK